MLAFFAAGSRKWVKELCRASMFPAPAPAAVAAIDDRGSSVIARSASDQAIQGIVGLRRRLWIAASLRSSGRRRGMKGGIEGAPLDRCVALWTAAVDNRGLSPCHVLRSNAKHRVSMDAIEGRDSSPSGSVGRARRGI